jgi:hypothetical protein
MPHARPGRQAVSAKTVATIASIIMSPTGYARSVASAAESPTIAFSATVWKTVTTPTAQTASAATTPSSNMLMRAFRIRLRTSSTIAT